MRAIVRALLVSVLVILVTFVVFSYSAGTVNWRFPPQQPAEPVGTTGTVSGGLTRGHGAELGKKAAVAAAKAGQAVNATSTTAKIKAKMALDDSVKARAIDVTTNGSTVTLTGTVSSRAEHDRAVALARETKGVTRVVDSLRITP